MAASPLKQYLDRSIGVLRRNTAKIIRMDLSPKPPPLTLFSFTADHPPISRAQEFATGSDADIGGLSTAVITSIPSTSSTSSAASSSASSPTAQAESSRQSHIAFHGNLSLAVPPAYQGRIRTGYAALRNKTRPTLFGEDTWDLSLYSHLRVVVGYRGWEGWRDKWVFNIQTDGPVRSDLFQHRLPLPPSDTSTSSRQTSDPLMTPPPVFTTLHLPVSSFVLTNSGQTVSHQIPMLREKVRTVGFALLGGGRQDDSAPPSIAEDEMKRVGAGGWNRGAGEVEVDRELEDLIASDRPAGERRRDSDLPKQAAVSGGESGGGGYHRVGSGSAASPAKSRSPEVDLARGEVEGYYELAVKSIEAVNWDPETDDGGDEDDRR